MNFTGENSSTVAGNYDRISFQTISSKCRLDKYLPKKLFNPIHPNIYPIVCRVRLRPPKNCTFIIRPIIPVDDGPLANFLQAVDSRNQTQVRAKRKLAERPFLLLRRAVPSLSPDPCGSDKDAGSLLAKETQGCTNIMSICNRATLDCARDESNWKFNAIFSLGWLKNPPDYKPRANQSASKMVPVELNVSAP